MTLEQLNKIFKTLDKCYTQTVSHSLLSQEENRLATQLNQCIIIVSQEINNLK